MKIVAIVPAKGCSDRIPSKNSQLLDGKPLFINMLEKLLQCPSINEVWLDTDSNEFIEIASELPIQIMKRDPKLASNTTDGNALFLNEVTHIDADIYLQVLCTSPFIDIETIEKTLTTLIHDPSYDSAVMVRKEKQYQWNNNHPSYDIDHIPNSIDLPDTIIETMGMYVMYRKHAINLQRRIGNNPYLVYATPIEAIDVNWNEDFQLANLIAAGIREKENHLLKNISASISSAILSDILDDLGYPNQVITQLKPYSPTKIFGRAKTLKLRKKEQHESPAGIYNALDTYKYIVPNDIIVVENEISDYAYFGELNANLAIRAGAIGTIINGVTRDSQNVENLNYPVFSKGYNCQDVKNRAVVEHFNKTIFLDKIAVEPNCLIYADNEGIVVIPQQVEHQVIEQALTLTRNERHILNDISNDINTDELVAKYGFF
ncbi:cytidylyltransferase domain-containing protein [Photobacterium aquimaris]|uniref:CMP-N,N'-diacetyllegionaminic acid synthase n=1 Tax=Photobacterium aquimaris TaxID=512643 RepID=A0A1Y6KZC0_9GAMM|nr:cytidyltransferase [Photobacterium aquimaris]SMY16427.1 CMP-N,N'-diacetyllegionaminic acid synthase [Photobacterium aquimaris]